jgi:hypothetical protein
VNQRHVVYPVVVVLAVVLTIALFWDRFQRHAHAPEVSTSASAASLTSATPPPIVTASARATASAKAPPPLPSYVHIDPRSTEQCGADMLLIDGVYCPFVGHTCKHFLIEERDVCDVFSPDVMCEGRLERRRFCIDRYEYPNLEGVLPVVMVDYNDAVRACSVEGKRLCDLQEWEFACEGNAMWPYPYGIDRDKTACNIDKTWLEPDLNAFSDPWKISSEVARLDQRVPSGSMDRCISSFGVRDMTGNVDEWVENKRGGRTEKPYRSTLKGGYWGPIRARCRPITSTHNEWFSFYQVGFRCCRDAPGSKPMEPAIAATVPRRQRMPSP